MRIFIGKDIDYWIQRIISLRLHRRNGRSKHDFLRHLHGDDCIEKIVIAKDGKKIAGWASLQKIYSGHSYAWHIQIYIQQKYRRKGIGTKCIKLLKGNLRNIIVDIDSAVKFWEHTGFIKIV